MKISLIDGAFEPFLILGVRQLIAQTQLVEINQAVSVFTHFYV